MSTENTEIQQKFLASVPEGVTPGWKPSVTIIEGKLAWMKLENEKMGVRMEYGLSPAGNYDQPIIAESGGGGAVAVPFTVNPITGQRYLGFLQQQRPLQSDQPLFCFPRGFKAPEETHEEAADKEFREETGEGQFTITHLKGLPVNPNSAFFLTRGGGVEFFAIRIPWEALNQDGDHFSLAKVPESAYLERISKCWFFAEDMKWIAGLGDSFTLMGYLRWLVFDRFGA